MAYPFRFFRFVCLSALLFTSLWQTASPPSAKAQTDSLRYEIKVSKYLMGTVVDATLIHTDVEEARADLKMAFAEMIRVEALLSTHLASSETSAVNRNAGQRPVRVSPETFAFLSRAGTYSERLDGLFDITIGSVSSLWGFSADEDPHLPSATAVAGARALVDFRNLILDTADTTAFLARQGMKIDLGGIAKGYAVDRAVRVLRSLGRNDFLINAGGDLYASGKKAADLAWRVGVQHPRRPDSLLATLTAEDEAVVTSGDYERFFIEDGVRYHHIFDPRSGYPATASRSATVVARTAEEADVLATYLFITGDNPNFRTRVRGGDLLAAGLFLRVDSSGAVTFDPELKTENDLEMETAND